MYILHTQDQGNLYNRLQISANEMSKCYFNDYHNPNLIMEFDNKYGKVQIYLSEEDAKRIADVYNKKYRR